MKLTPGKRAAGTSTAAIRLPQVVAILAALTVLSPASRAQSGKRADEPAAPAQMPVTQTAAMRAGPMSGDLAGRPVSRDTNPNVGPSSLQAASPIVRRGWAGRGRESASAVLPADPKDESRGARLHPKPGGDFEANRRDPFRLPLPAVAAGTAGAQQRKLPMVPGKRGLVISQLRLEGTVRGGPRPANGGTGSGGSGPSEAGEMIAVVTGASGIAYFLREGDGLYDGRVTRITPESVCFDEEYLDLEGRARTRQVVKRLGAVSNEEP